MLCSLWPIGYNYYNVLAVILYKGCFYAVLAVALWLYYYNVLAVILLYEGIDEGVAPAVLPTIHSSIGGSCK